MLCSHCEQLVETLSQASEELRARESGRSTSAAGSLNIDDIEVYEVSEGSEAEVEVRITASAANRLIGEVVQSRRRPLLGPSPG